MATGYINILLHAHLPFIRHPEYEKFLEETWLFEAMSETYLPLLRMMNRLDSEDIPINLSISFSPTLTAMLKDDLLKERYSNYLDQMILLGEKEIERTKHDPSFGPLAQMYYNIYLSCKREFEHYDGDILRGYDYLNKKGKIELITTAGTYPFLPFYEQYPANINAQVEVAINSHYKNFGRAPKGFWLPECGYLPGVEEHLKDNGIEYFYTTAHGILFSPDIPKSGLYAPIKTPNGLAVFARDISSANLVWSPKSGYPGDVEYRDFYRDIGFDLPLDDVRDFIHLNEVRTYTGYKYRAITGQTDDKRIYDPQRAQIKAGDHAENFLYHQHKQIKKLKEFMDEPPIISSPYSAELFGHWWFEGPIWLEAILRKAQEDKEVEFITPSNYLKQVKTRDVVQPVFSSWGNKGYAETWLDGSNHWIYRHIHMAIERMQELVERFPEVTGLKERALNQAAREVLLCQALDWPVIMRSGAAEEYAKGRIKEHLGNFYRIYDALGQGKLGTEWLTRVERKNNIFPDLDYRTFHVRNHERKSKLGHPYALQASQGTK